MRAYILSLPTRLQAFLIITITIIMSLLIAKLAAMFFDTHQLEANTDLIATVYQVLGTIYAILLTFTLWGVWQNFSLADEAVQSEAYTLIDLVHMLESVPRWDDIPIRLRALDYSQAVLKNEWPKLKNMTNDYINYKEATICRTMQIVRLIQSIVPRGEHEQAIFSQSLTLMTNWLDARRRRLLIARGNSAKALWPLLISGSFVLFAFHGLFVAKTIGIWVALLFGFSLIAGITFYLIFTLDCPFGGFPCVDPEPFKFSINVFQLDDKTRGELVGDNSVK